MHIGRIATGEIEDEHDPIKTAAAELGSRGGKARSVSLSAERRRQIAKDAAKARWGDQAQAQLAKKEQKEQTPE